MRRMIFLVVASALFIGAVIGVVAGFNVPNEKEERVTHLTYESEGNFNHKAFEMPKPEVKTALPYFMKLIDSIIVQYSYQLLTAEPVTSVTEKVEISAVVSSPGTWKKELILVPMTEQSGAFTISFPLVPDDFFSLAGNIMEEIGTGRATPDVMLKANVHIEAQTEAGMLNDNFTQTLQVRLSPVILEWDGELTRSEMRYAQGLRYMHHGNFGYAIDYKPNIIFGPVTMVPKAPPPPGPPVAVKSSDSYDAETIDSINGTFSYKFDSDEPLKGITNEVEVTATLGRTGVWEETFLLVPKSQETGEFSVTFPLDVPFYYTVIRSYAQETDTPNAGELIITADVHTIAQSEFGPIDETFNKSLKVTLGPEKIEWPGVEPKTKSGSIEETVIVSNPAANMAKIGSLGVLGMMAVALLYAIWSYWEFKRKWISRIEADTIQVRSKHQDSVVDVEKLPDIASEVTVIEIGSLSELIKVADGLFKPVLHLAEPERHIYCVIDGAIRYQYVSPQQYVKLSEYR